MRPPDTVITVLRFFEVVYTGYPATRPPAAMPNKDNNRGAAYPTAGSSLPNRTYSIQDNGQSKGLGGLPQMEAEKEAEKEASPSLARRLAHYRICSSLHFL